MTRYQSYYGSQIYNRKTHCDRGKSISNDDNYYERDQSSSYMNSHY